MEKRDNYEIMKRQMQAKFAAIDMARVSAEWELPRIGGALRFTLLGRPYRLDEASGAVLFERDGEAREADYNVSMTVFDVLSRPRQIASGELLPVSAFSTVHSATVSSGSLFDRAARRLDGRDAALSAACTRLGGVAWGKGDVAFKLPVFRDLWAAVSFWDSDEDFGPELNFFCDKNILRFMHFETMMFLLLHLAERLCEETENAD